MNAPDITIEFEYLPFPPKTVRVHFQGGGGKDSANALWAAAQFEHRGKEHTVWVELDPNDEYHFKVLKGRIGSTIGLLEEIHLRSQIGDALEPSRKEADVAPRSVLVREGYVSAWWDDIETVRLVSFQGFWDEGRREEWVIEVIEGVRTGQRCKAYVYRVGREPREDGTA